MNVKPICPRGHVKAEVGVTPGRACRACQREQALRYFHSPKGQVGYRRRLQSEQRLWNDTQRNARARGYGFSLTRQEFSALLAGDCYYCGAPAQPRNGIDRVDNTRGYVAGNVVSACSSCNYAKRSLSFAEFKDWVLGLVVHVLLKAEDSGKVEVHVH